MKTDITKLLRPSIAKLSPYSSARDEYRGEEALLLDANENPFNSPYNRYPDPQQLDLKRRIAERKDLSDKQIFLGNGSDEAIDILFRIFCEPSLENAVTIHPSYGMYQVCADINNVQLKKVALNEDFSLDKEAIVSACDENTKLLFICSPNNPTSNSYDPEEILDLASKLDLIVVVDEAYIDFSSRQSLKNYIENYSNIVILQTFSKAWALAGIRLGMAIADPEIIQYMSKIKYPYNINMLTINFAMDALDDSQKVKNWIALILKERELLERKLKKYRFVEKVYPSDANFLLVKVAKPKKVYSYLVEKKIIVRDRSNVQLCEGSLRITVGSEKENLELTEAMMNYQRDFVDSCSI